MHDNISRPCVQHGVTPFFHAVKRGQSGHAKDLALVGRLLEAKADPDAADNDGQTALMWSSKEGHKNLLDFCLRAGGENWCRVSVRDDIFIGLGHVSGESCLALMQPAHILLVKFFVVVRTI